MRGEPPHPKAEFRIAVAGPLSSFFLSIVFFYLSWMTSGGMKAIFSYVSQINLILGAFNLIPGFPMDGGRVLRSILWKRGGDYFHATQQASGVGQKIALFFIFFGIFSLFAGMPGGLWLMLIGWFLHTAAQISYQQAGLQQTFSGVKVKDIMAKDLVTIRPTATVEEAVNDYFLRYGYGGFPVAADGKYLGIITLKEIKEVPREKHKYTTISEVYLPRSPKWEMAPDEEVIKALETMLKENVGRLVIREGDKIAGLITRNGISRYLELMGE